MTKTELLNRLESAYTQFAYFTFSREELKTIAETVRNLNEPKPKAKKTAEKE